MEIEGLKTALKSINTIIESEASNLSKANVKGAKATRVSIDSNGLIETGTYKLAGPDTSITAANTDFSQGSLEQTKSATDLAIQGKGFFLLQDAAGDVYLTRQGNFHFDNSGFLVNQNGLFVASFNPKTNGLMKTDKLTLDGQGNPADVVQFNSYGVLINESKGLKEGKQLALGNVSNLNGLAQSKYGPEIYHITSASGTLEMAGAGDNGMGSVNGFALEGSNTSAAESLEGLSFWQKNFTSTVSAAKTFLSAWDDMNNTIK